jgi:hypothetical protein
MRSAGNRETPPFPPSNNGSSALRSRHFPWMSTENQTHRTTGRPNARLPIPPRYPLMLSIPPSMWTQ